MTKYNILSDTHFYGADPTDLTTVEPSDQAVAILCGDIFDLKNAKKKDVNLAQAGIAKYKIIFGERYIEGNHEGCKTNKHFISNGTIFVHGHFISYDNQKAINLATFTPGKGWFSRFYKMIGSKLRNLYTGKLNADQLERAYLKATTHNCSTLVMGHKHPRNQIDVTYKGIRIIVLKRGLTTLTLQ